MPYDENTTTKAKQSFNGGKRVKEEMGMWLSLLPPSIHLCSVCKKIFKSVPALAGHQNAHRTPRLQIEMNNVDPKWYEEEKERRVGDAVPMVVVSDDQSCNFIGDEVPMVMANDPNVVANYEDQSEIDLNLHLGFGRCKKVINFFDFMPVKKMKADGFGIGGACDLHDFPLRIDRNEGGVDVGSGGNLPKTFVSDGEHGGKDGKKKFSSKKRVNLTLKL